MCVSARECTRNADGTWRPGYVAAALVFAIGMAGTTLPTPLYGLYQEQLGFSELMVTVVFAVYAVAVITVLLVAGNYSDETGRRPVLLCALGLSAASAGCFLLEGGLPLLFAGRLLSGCAGRPAERRGDGGRDRTGGARAEGACGVRRHRGEHGRSGLRPAALGDPRAVHALAADPAVLGPSGSGGPGLRDHLVPAGDRRRAEAPTPPEAAGAVRARRGEGVFLPASLAAFAGFALLGLFTAVAPSFASHTLGVHNLAVSGAVVFSVFLASTAGQSLSRQIGARLALPVGCGILVVGLLLVASSLIAESLLLLVLGALCGGTGQGLAFRAALTLISDAAPAQHRGGTISSFFVVAYCGISVPVVGVGALATWLGLRQAGLIFAGCVMLLAAGAGTYAARRLPREPDLQPGPPPTTSSRS